MFCISYIAHTHLENSTPLNVPTVNLHYGVFVTHLLCFVTLYDTAVVCGGIEYLYHFYPV